MADDKIVQLPMILKRYRFRDEITLTRRPWLMRGLLLRGYVTTLLAAGGVGKSNFGLTVGLHLCAGKSFGPWKCRRPLKVAVLSVEDSADELDLRLHAIRRQFGFDQDAAANLFVVQWFDEPILATTDQKGAVRATLMAEELERIAFREGIDVVVIDPFIEVWLGSENDNSQVRQAAAIIRGIVRRIGAACLLMHHVKKGGVTPGDIDSSRGASSLSGLVRVGFTLTNMTAEDAKELGLDSHKGFVRADSAKGNYLPAADQAHWFKFEEIRLDNGDDFAGEIGDGVGVLVPWSPESARAGSDLGKPQKAENLFLELLEWHNARGLSVSINTASRNYAPLKFIAHPNTDRKVFGVKDLVAAMHALDQSGRIRSEKYGKKSDDTYRLVVVNFNP